jgi:hypothetical protein
MSSRAKPVPATISGQTLDRLFLDCAKLETLVLSIRDAMDRLDPAVDSGMVTAEHLMNLAFRIENAERGLIAIAHQIGNTASSVIDRRKQAILIH